MRGGDEHHPPDERQVFEEQRPPQSRLEDGINVEALEGLVADGAPQPVAGIDRGEAGQQTALAMADHHHLP